MFPFKLCINQIILCPELLYCCIFESNKKYAGASHVVLEVNNLPANVRDIRDVSSIPGLGNPGEGHGNPLQYSYLENPMDRGAWWAVRHN